MKDKIPTKEMNPNGLHSRFYIQKIEGLTPHEDFFGNTYFEPILKEVDAGAEYFVLRLDKGGSDPIHIEACRKAVMRYAEEIEGHLPELSRDLIERYGS